MGAGILPIAIHRGVLLILLGQERHNNLWCDFGGGSNKRESPFNTAIREGSEELNGFMGSDNELKETVNNNLLTSITYDKYTSYVFKVNYNKDLPYYFENNNKFAEKHMQNLIRIPDNGLFEKTQIKWFRAKDLKNEFISKNIRLHYQEIINHIIKNEKKIILTANRKL